MGKFMDWWRDMKVFSLYMLSRPFAEVWTMLKTFYKSTEALDRPIFYVNFFSVLTALLLVVAANTHYYPPLIFMTIITFIAILRFEWISGRFRKWHVDNLKARAKRMEAKNNGNVN